jgi:hypothetical protein
MDDGRAPEWPRCAAIVVGKECRVGEAGLAVGDEERIKKAGRLTRAIVPRPQAQGPAKKAFRKSKKSWESVMPL